MEQLLLDNAHWVALAVSVVVVAGKIADITPTKADNKAIEWIYKIFAVIGIKTTDNKGK